MNGPNHITLLKIIALAILLTTVFGNLVLVADVGNRGAWGDQGDGTFKNSN